MVALLLVLGVLVLGAVVAWAGWRAAKERREAMAAFAASRGWQYAADDPTLVDRWDGTPFGTGHSRRTGNVLRGTHDGRPIVAFDYQYSTTHSNGKTTTTQVHPFSVVAMSTGVRMPDLAVQPENLLGRFVGRLTGSDIELESEEFNRAFTVTAADRRFAYDVLHPQMMQMLLSRPDFGWRVEGDTLLVVRPGRQSPAEIDDELACADAILDRVPDFVWQQLRGS